MLLGFFVSRMSHRTCTKGEVIKAYRRKAVKWHPDHYRGEDKKLAERMFIDLAAAKEVLTDPGTDYVTVYPCVVVFKPPVHAFCILAGICISASLSCNCGYGTMLLLTAILF